MHLHNVFVLLYSVCCSVNVLLRMDVIQSFTYVLCAIILGIAQEKSERQYEWRLVNTVRKQKKNKTGTSVCGSFVVAYFQPSTSNSIDRLQY